MNVVADISALPQAVNEDWYKDAIIYQLHVKAFADSNDDGVGDFVGLTQRLDYLQDLGVNAIWLLPFYPSPGRDDGYDIADYRRINPAFGTMADFNRFMFEAKKRGLKVITELVINHTSDQHPWFKRARRSSPGSNARHWYVWSDNDQKYAGTRIIFTDTEKSNWAWDQTAGAYYWHRFFSHQPDLNYANPQVFSAIVQVMRRWLDAGVDGFRLDAIPYLCEREGTTSENLPETHDVIKRLRAELQQYSPGTVLLAEANQWPEDVSAYFGDGDECHMAYHFPLMPRIYMAIAQEDRFPITDILRQTPDIPANCQWALFLRNHDELTLEMVTDAERDYLWSTYAADPQARINLGIRRRLAPLMDNDRRKIELMNSLLMSFPGTPVLYYGDELGMGDNIYLGDRNGVRTPMQWTPDRNGGFSRCDPAKMFLPPIMDPVYGYHAINVEAQARNISSLLSWTKRMIAVRRTSKVFGRGSLSFIRPPNRSVLAYIREYDGEAILCVANLSRSAQAVELDLAAWKGRVPVEMVGRARFGAIDDRPYSITLAPYGFFWLQLTAPSEGATNQIAQVPEWITLVLADGLKSLTEGRTRTMFERDVLPPFLASRRWFAHKDSRRLQTIVHGVISLTNDDSALIAMVDVHADDETARYALPVTVEWTRFDRAAPEDKASLIASVRRTNREGVLVEAVADRNFVAAIASNIHAGRDIGAEDRRIQCRPSKRFAADPLPAIETVRSLRADQSNSTVLADDAFVLKFYRRILGGLNPEFEMGRFLTDVAGYANTPALLGTVELVEGETASALAIMHEFVGNQGDAWQFTTAYLDRVLDEERLVAADATPAEERHAAFNNRIQQIGRRIGELHTALTSHPDVAEFAPTPVTSDDLRRWTSTLAANTSDLFARLERNLARLDEKQADVVNSVLSQKESILEHFGRLLPPDIDVDKIRQHGDLHLGQILMVKDDAVVIDFEGEPNRSLDDRRAKMPAARDVAGMIRSIDYAATSALMRIAAALPDEVSRLAAFVDAWRTQATSAFLAGVRETSSVARLWPSDDGARSQLVRFFVVEKAIYEIGYELSNRSDWLAVPISGMLRALAVKERTS